MSTYLSPISNDQVVDSNGAPLVGGWWNVYLAGTSTPVTTYTDSTGITPQPTDITLDASGRPANPIWLSGGIPVKFRLSSAAGVVLLTVDNVSGINDPAGITAQDQWVLYGAAPTYLSATSFSVAGDQTNTFQIGRRIKSTNTGGVRYSSITNSVYGAVTTVTVTNDSGTLDSGISAVSYGLLSSLNMSVPTTIARSGAVTASGLTQATARMLGRTTASTGAIEELTAANVAAFTAAATTSAQGVSQLATGAEVVTGTDAAKTVTPSTMKAGLNATGSAPTIAARAWCFFNGTTAGTNAPTAGVNVTSVTRNGAGDYTINFTTAMSSSSYSVVAMGASNAGTRNMNDNDATTARTTSAVRILSLNSANAATDSDRVSVIVFGG